MRRIERAVAVDMSWPHLQASVDSPVRAAIARTLFLRSLRKLRLAVVMPDGTVHGAGRGTFDTGGDPAIRIIDPHAFFSRIGRGGALGFGESYLAGAWDAGPGGQTAAAATDELVAWLGVYASALQAKESTVLYALRRLWRRRLPVSQLNSETGAQQNVQAHYDLDTRLFELFLDPSMTYSSAWFAEPDTDDLASAQVRKVDPILDMAGIGAGTQMLDIGFGFGFLAFRAAGQRGAAVTGITLSQKQHEYAAQRLERLDLVGDVNFRLEDYRRHSGIYDAIVSVEMIEAVGADYWVDYFTAIDRLLAPGGRVALQAITYPHQKMLQARTDFSWVDRYIFPGGALPSLEEINRILRTSTTMEIVEQRRLSDSYARTLREWRHRFLGETQAVLALGFDETFIRLWALYFAYFEAGFRVRYCDVWQLGLARRSAFSEEIDS